MVTQKMDLARVESLWRPIDAAESGRVAALVVMAEALVTAEDSGVQSRLASGALARDVYEAVVVDMVRIAMANPEGVASASESAGPFSHSASFTNPAGLISLSAAHRKLLGISLSRGSVMLWAC